MVRTGLGHGGITCVLQTQFSSFFIHQEMALAGGIHAPLGTCFSFAQLLCLRGGEVPFETSFQVG